MCYYRLLTPKLTNSCNRIFMAYLLTVANYGEHPYPATAIDTVIFGFDLLITAINSTYSFPCLAEHTCKKSKQSCSY